MSQVDILSGLGGKSSAAIRVRHQGRSLLMDAGGPLHPQERCDWVRETGPLDAILISHDHPDHIGSVARLPWGIPLYCTPEVATALPPGRSWRPLPRQGSRSILGIEVTTGRAGHSHGGLWLHLDVGDGLFYSGDASFESLLFPFDPPPPAGTLLLDASYGLYDTGQRQCQQALWQQLTRPTVLPLPLSGRAIELALWLLRMEKTQPIDWTMDRHCHQMVCRWTQCDPDAFRPGLPDALQRLADRRWPEHAPTMLVADRNDGHWDWPGRRLLHTGYLTPDRRERVAAGLEHWQRWNVHLRAGDLVRLRDTLGARRLVPLFTSLTQTAAWRDRLGPQLHTDSVLELNDAVETKPFHLSAPR
ncbi:MBL fold metallo-hydrolase [Modicisalibacter radicis]|uniref:MBL fold metallo-hydrolase n=1 Tax=Halomonas sp. EAR18 TaxID=2518972 RepID=UPI001FCEF1BC|nr:MBL fold metallo-hydrolase [Halomonas sp. EAR18]